MPTGGTRSSMLQIRLPKLWVALLLVFPLLQLGGGAYLSFSFLAFVYLVVKPGWPNISARILLAALVASLPLLLKAFLNAFTGAELREVMFPVREAVCLVVLCLGAMRIHGEKIDERALRRIVFAMLLATVCLVGYQYVSLVRGAYFGFPVEWFFRNQTTLEGAELALFYESGYRPTAFYGEPSYAAFVVLSLFVVALEAPARGRFKLAVIAITATVAYLLQSMSGFLAIFAYLGLWAATSREVFVRDKRLVVFAATAVTATLIVLVNDYASQRLIGIIAGTDASSAGRINAPMGLLAETLLDGKFAGASALDMVEALGPASLDNALFRMLIYYGLLVLPSLAVVGYLVGWNRVLLYLLLATSFNGDFFSYDKVVVMAFVIGTTVKLANGYKK